MRTIENLRHGVRLANAALDEAFDTGNLEDACATMALVGGGFLQVAEQLAKDLQAQTEESKS